jgi:hypothetical protein
MVITPRSWPRRRAKARDVAPKPSAEPGAVLSAPGFSHAAAGAALTTASMSPEAPPSVPGSAGITMLLANSPSDPARLLVRPYTTGLSWGKDRERPSGCATVAACTVGFSRLSQRQTGRLRPGNQAARVRSEFASGTGDALALKGTDPPAAGRGGFSAKGVHRTDRSDTADEEPRGSCRELARVLQRMAGERTAGDRPGTGRGGCKTGDGRGHSGAPGTSGQRDRRQRRPAAARPPVPTAAPGLAGS